MNSKRTSPSAFKPLEVKARVQSRTRSKRSWRKRSRSNDVIAASVSIALRRFMIACLSTHLYFDQEEGEDGAIFSTLLVPPASQRSVL
jgi:hypothetical protein